MPSSLLSSLPYSFTLLARALVIVAVVLACSPDQPRPPANNPRSVLALCGDANPCADGLTCHVAVAGGTCESPCNEQAEPDAFCGSIVSGYVCHPTLGACAPSCNTDGDDRLCEALGGVCQSDARCLFVGPSVTTFVRMFNATGDAPLELRVDGDGVTVGLTPPAQLSPEDPVGAGTRRFSLHDAAGNEVATGEAELRGGRHVIFVPYRTNAGTVLVAVVDDAAPGTATADVTWLRYLNLGANLGNTQELRLLREGGAPEIIAGGVEFGDARDFVSAAPGTVSVEVGRSLSSDVLQKQAATLEAQQTYTVVTWSSNFGAPIPETTVISRQGVIARLRSTGIRSVNALSLAMGETYAPMAVLLGDSETRLAQTNRADQTGPVAGYRLTAPGSTRLRAVLGTDVRSDVTLELGPAQRYSAYCYGLVSAGTSVCNFLNESIPLVMPAGRIALRVAHLSVANEGALVDVEANAASVASGVAYGQLSEFVDLPAEPLDLFVRFQDGTPPTTFRYTPRRAGLGVTVYLSSGPQGVAHFVDDSGASSAPAATP